MDHTSWFDPLDPMNDSVVHPSFAGLDPLDDGTAAKAARDLIRESGRQPVLDEALLEALDAAAKAAAARRAVTVAVPLTAETAVAVLPPTTVASPVVAAPVVAVTPAPPPAPPVPAPVPVDTVVVAPVEEPALDVSAEFARHDDLVETGRHASVVDHDWVYDSGPQAPFTETGRHLALEIEDDEDDDRATPLTHRTVVTRSSARRWIPAGVGVGVVAIVGAVLLTSGFGADASSTGTDEAARTGASTTEAATPAATTPALPTPAMNTLDLSGPVVVDPADVTQPTASSARSTAAVQPQVAVPPRTAPQAPAGGGTTSGSGTDTGTGAGTTTLTASTPTPPPSTSPSSSSSAGESSTGSGSSSSSSSPEPGTTTG